MYVSRFFHEQYMKSWMSNTLLEISNTLLEIENGTVGNFHHPTGNFQRGEILQNFQFELCIRNIKAMTLKNSQLFLFIFKIHLLHSFPEYILNFLIFLLFILFSQYPIGNFQKGSPYFLESWNVYKGFGKFQIPDGTFSSAQVLCLPDSVKRNWAHETNT